MLRCYDCGCVVPAEVVSCPTCGGFDFTNDETGPTRPTKGKARDLPALPWPWAQLSFPDGYAMTLTGGPGMGKSSLAALLAPDHWITNEMEPADVGALVSRIAPAERVPLVHVINCPEQIPTILGHAFKGEWVVVDSLAGFGLEGGPVVLNALRDWAQRERGRVVCINQVAKDGAGAGRRKLEHDPDIVAYVRGDTSGRRRLDVTKNRGGPLFSATFTFDARGQIGRAGFPYAYSVEGTPGNYRLTAFPDSKAKWAGFYRALPDDFGAIEGTASAARPAEAYKGGWLMPSDVSERRRFAEAHGLRWIDPTQHPEA